MIAAVGALDSVTDLEIRVFPLYFAPVAYAAIGLGAWAGVAVSLLCSLVWLGSSLASGNSHATWLIATNATLQFGACVVVALMIARLRVLLAAEHAHARLDALTGLANRRLLSERADVELARLGRGAGPMVVASLDLDGFKAVNDREGHARGDQLLQAVAAALQARLREVDLVARVGGDEFVLVLPDISASDAAAVLERVRADVARAATREGTPVTATVGGVVLRPGERRALDPVLQLADQALYAAKRAGRDRVTLDDPGRAA